MSLESLESTLSAEFNRAPRESSTSSFDPYDLIAGDVSPFSGGDSRPNTNREQEQYKHNRGRFYSAGRIIVSRFSQQPIYVGRGDPRKTNRSLHSLMHKGLIHPASVPEWLGMSDTVELLSFHPANSAVNEPNQYTTSFNMKEMVAWSAIITGRAFVVAFNSSRKGRSLDLYAVPTTWMKPWDKDHFQSHWRIQPPGARGEPIIASDSQVAHFYFADPSNPAKCLSPMAMMSMSVLTDEAISSTQHAEFRDGVTPKVALIAGDVMNETSFTDDPNRSSAARPVRLEPHQRQQIITWFRQQYAGLRNQGLPIVLDAVIRDIKLLSRSPAEMAFIESAGLTKEQIFEGLGVARVLAGQLEDVNRATGGLAEQLFADNTLNPMITAFSQALTMKFGPLFAVDDEKLLLWMAPAVPRDSELDVELLRLGIRSYSVKRNEVRDVLRTRFGGLPRLDDMDDVVMPQTLDERDEDFSNMGIGRIGGSQSLNGRSHSVAGV